MGLSVVVLVGSAGTVFYHVLPGESETRHSAVDSSNRRKQNCCGAKQDFNRTQRTEFRSNELFHFWHLSPRVKKILNFLKISGRNIKTHYPPIILQSQSRPTNRGPRTHMKRIFSFLCGLPYPPPAEVRPPIEKPLQSDSVANFSRIMVRSEHVSSMCLITFCFRSPELITACAIQTTIFTYRCRRSFTAGSVHNDLHDDAAMTCIMLSAWWWLNGF